MTVAEPFARVVENRQKRLQGPNHVELGLETQKLAFFGVRLGRFGATGFERKKPQIH